MEEWRHDSIDSLLQHYMKVVASESPTSIKQVSDAPELVWNLWKKEMPPSRLGIKPRFSSRPFHILVTILTWLFWLQQNIGI
jgi:hypothetical protein